MVDKKITELTAMTTPVAADIIAMVDDIVGTATTKKITYANFEANLSLTASQVSDFDTEVANNSAVSANTSKNTNVPTALSTGTVNGTSYGITSDSGADDVVLAQADTNNAGVLSAVKWDEIVANTLKDTNVSTNLSEGTSTETTVDVNSSDGTNATLASASTSRAGLLTKAKWDEIVANTSKSTNVSTNLSAGSLTATTIDVDSSDGTNATLVEADTTNAGILGSDKWDEIVANSVHTAGDGSDHADVASNTSASHAQNTDTALGSGAVAADHGTDSTDQIINVSYGTSATPPTASTTTEGSLYVQYTA